MVTPHLHIPTHHEAENYVPSSLVVLKMLCFEN